MHAGDDGDGTAAVDHGNPLRREMQAEIGSAVGDRLVDRSARRRIDKPDLAEAFVVQQPFGDKLGRMADRRSAHQAYRRRFERPLRRRRKRRARHACGAGQ
jgi:hypothetical protein